MNENEAKALIERFAGKQQNGHFACPRCGKMTMDSENVTRNALSRRVSCYICDVCGMQEALEDMVGSLTPLTAWAISTTPVLWLEYRGRDSRDRPVYECDGKLYVDTDPRRSRMPNICTKYGNAFDGEPDTPISDDIFIAFASERDAWDF